MSSVSDINRTHAALMKLALQISSDVDNLSLAFHGKARPKPEGSSVKSTGPGNLLAMFAEQQMDLGTILSDVLKDLQQLHRAVDPSLNQIERAVESELAKGL